MVESTQIHGTCVLLRDAGVLIRGPSGSGKSDLALRLIDGGGILVADDRVDLTVAQGFVWARPPEALAGKLEIRGVGIVDMAFRPKGQVALVVDFIESQGIDRLPEKITTPLLDIPIPCLKLDPFTVSAVAKIRAMVEILTGNRIKLLDSSLP
ncbi:MAG: hypothetical protein R3E60_05185 [Alphaproteobacteria bacterium]